MIDVEAMDRSLRGLSVGDAFGQASFGQDIEALLHNRVMPGDEWPWTDDTAQALVLSSHLLRQQGTIDLPTLALEFAKEYQSNPLRGYGGTAHRVLRLTAAGEDWSRVSQDVFSGQGSMGNGAAMRVAPLGALLWRDINQVIQEAGKSARPTHANPEAAAGAIAVAVAAALSAGTTLAGPEFLQEVADRTPESETRSRLLRAASMEDGSSVRLAVFSLGNGSDMLTQHTVPFCIWAASRSLNSFPNAMWTTLSALGDRDTTCAIVGGIVGARIGPDPALEARREPLPDWR